MIAGSTRLKELIRELEPIAGGTIELQMSVKARRGDSTCPSKYVTVPLDRTARDWWGDIGADSPSYAKYLLSITSGPHKNRYIALFSIAYFPGCCALAVGTGAVTYSPFYNKGVNNITNLIRMEISRLMGYTAYIATDVAHNTPSMKTFARNGMKELYECKNKRTNNVVKLFVKEL